MDLNLIKGNTERPTTTNTPSITTSGYIPYNTTTDTSDSSCTIGGINPLLVLYTSAAATCLASLTIGFCIHRQFFANRMIRNALRNTAAVLGISTRDTRINIEGVRAIEEFDKEIEREFKSFKVSLKSARKKHLTQSNFEVEILSSIRTSVNSIVALGRTINPSNNYKVEAYQREFEKYLDAVCNTQEKLHAEYHKKIDAKVRGDCMKKAWQLLQTCPHATQRQQKFIREQIAQKDIDSDRTTSFINPSCTIQMDETPPTIAELSPQQIDAQFGLKHHTIHPPIHDEQTSNQFYSTVDNYFDHPLSTPTTNTITTTTAVIHATHGLKTDERTSDNSIPTRLQLADVFSRQTLKDDITTSDTQSSDESESSISTDSMQSSNEYVYPVRRHDTASARLELQQAFSALEKENNETAEFLNRTRNQILALLSSDELSAGAVRNSV